MDKYGSITYIGSKECHDKYKESNLLKSLETKKNNHTFNTSKPEEEYYKLLVSLYGESDVIRNYKCDRYPFSCDFYIISLDLFIECNYHWTHGGGPFNSNNSECIKKLVSWEDKANLVNKYFRNAINTWTIRDVNKRKIARDNDLNYIEIFK